MRAMRSSRAIAWAIATLLVAAPGAAAHGDEVHDTPHAGGGAAAGNVAGVGATPGGGGATPGSIPQVNEPVTGGGAPAPGAQPAAPSGLPPVVAGTGTAGANAAGAAGAAANATTGAAPGAAPGANATTGANGAGTAGTTGATATIMPKADLDSISEPVTTEPKTASGGGTGGVDAGGDVLDSGAAAVPDGVPTTVSGSGDLPFTGIDDTIRVVAIAGMFVPIGVLLYCGAQRGDRRRLERVLAMPRFQWAPSRPE